MTDCRRPGGAGRWAVILVVLSCAACRHAAPQVAGTDSAGACRALCEIEANGCRLGCGIGPAFCLQSCDSDASWCAAACPPAQAAASPAGD